MAGHSKWANIKHRKGRQDALRGKKNTKFIREITVAAREAGGDPKSNPRLRLAIEKANHANVTKDSIKKAIDKGVGNIDGEDYAEVIYEGYVPMGVAILVVCLTDNKNRTVAEVRHAFTKYGGNLGTSGSVSYMFARQGLIVCSQLEDIDAFMDEMFELDIEDVSLLDEQSVAISTMPNNLVAVLEYCKSKSYHVVESDLIWHADNSLSLTDEGNEKLENLVHVLEELDDVQSVFTNAGDE